MKNICNRLRPHDRKWKQGALSLLSYRQKLFFASNSFRVQYLLFCDLCLNTCVKNWAIVMKTTDHAKGVLKNLPPLLHYRFMTLCATLWILLLFWVLRVWGIDCSCKRLYLAMQATHVCCWAFRQKGLTLELRGYLHGREGQQRAKEIRATQHLQRLQVMLAWADELVSMMVPHWLNILLIWHMPTLLGKCNWLGVQIFAGAKKRG